MLAPFGSLNSEVHVEIWYTCWMLDGMLYNSIFMLDLLDGTLSDAPHIAAKEKIIDAGEAHSFTAHKFATRGNTFFACFTCLMH